MDRAKWLKKKRRETQQRYDELFAPTYDQDWGTIYATHARFVHQFLVMCPPKATILDAACGTGKYWPMILASGRKVFGIDQSQEMLNRAREKHPGVRVKRVGLQEMRFREAFNGAICVDAMEFVPPEDWGPVLDNLHLAIKPGAYLYFTVEITREKEVQSAFAAGQQGGLPVTYGECAHQEGYHYYPRIEQVEAWARSAGFHLIEDAAGADYHHFLVQRR